MKYIPLLFLFLASSAFADNKCNIRRGPEARPTGGDCEVVKVWTRCDVDKAALRHKIAVLEKRVKELEAKQDVVHYIYKYETKTVVKHNLLSVYAVRDITHIGVDGSTAYVDTAYEPGLKYGYMFDSGVTPEIGIDVKGHALFGLGLAF